MSSTPSWNTDDIPKDTPDGLISLVYLSSGMAFGDFTPKTVRARTVAFTNNEDPTDAEFRRSLQAIEDLLEKHPKHKAQFQVWLEKWTTDYEIEFEVDMDP